MNWERLLAVLYERYPAMYFRLARLPWRKRNPQVLEYAVGSLKLAAGDHALPLFLLASAHQYEARGGVRNWPESAGLEDALLRDVLTREDQVGPIGDAVRWSQERWDTVAEWLGSENGFRAVAALVAPVLDMNPRLRGLLDVNDLVQEALLLAQEVRVDPGVIWDLGRPIHPSAVPFGHSLLRTVLGRLLPQRFRTNTRLARELISLEESGDLAEAEDHDPAMLAEAAESRRETTRTVLTVLASLPPRQREAAEISYRAMAAGVSLEEQARQEGKDPKKARENFKAVQRRFPR